MEEEKGKILPFLCLPFYIFLFLLLSENGEGRLPKTEGKKRNMLKHLSHHKKLVLDIHS